MCCKGSGRDAINPYEHNKLANQTDRRLSGFWIALLSAGQDELEKSPAWAKPPDGVQELERS
jgi:hypothetical protein